MNERTCFARVHKQRLKYSGVQISVLDKNTPRHTVALYSTPNQSFRSSLNERDRNPRRVEPYSAQTTESTYTQFSLSVCVQRITLFKRNPHTRAKQLDREMVQSTLTCTTMSGSSPQYLYHENRHVCSHPYYGNMREY